MPRTRPMTGMAFSSTLPAVGIRLPSARYVSLESMFIEL
jgi:hypothetical protein